jgi:hypothetical protein
MKPTKPMLPRKRPLWLLVLAVMLVFGFYQERAKIQLNHYTQVMQENPELESFSEEVRAQWWQENPQPRRIHYYIMHGTWSGFHTMSISQLRYLKWGLSLLILVVFFALDGLFLQTTGHFERWPWLFVMYGLSGAIMAAFIALMPGKSGYGVAHEFLAFLQSPLPSLFIVLVPSLIERMRVEP